MGIGDYLPFWGKLTRQQQEQLSGSAVEKRYAKGALVSGEGQECTGLLLVLSGQLRAYILSQEGKEITLYRLLPRDLCLFSASCMLNSLEFTVMVEAMEDTSVYLIPSDMYKKLMEQCLPISNYTNELMASRFSSVVWLIEQVLGKRMDSRLAALLLEEAELAGNDVLEITHEQLAGHLGSAREVVTRMLRYFQQEGMVSLSRGKIKLIDLGRLSAIAQESIR